MYCACPSIHTYTLLRVYRYVYVCYCMFIFKFHCYIMSNICDRTDTSTCTYYFMVKHIRLCIV